MLQTVEASVPHGSGVAEGGPAGLSSLPGTDTQLVAALLWLICGHDCRFTRLRST